MYYGFMKIYLTSQGSRKKEISIVFIGIFKYIDSYYFINIVDCLIQRLPITFC